ncbi:TolC family protein [Sandaracinus amylolyticus]|uniref:TolC family protein n=1 Tax=Sandaracinus amylolyticus TaxID=927083 RepID=UPI001F02BFA4|nr:TolC family protein [Sandaracinus amylolyticus]UJR78753.1 Hypothetical protein I5071_7850 [Sandaracinus amylolyticus]
MRALLIVLASVLVPAHVLAQDEITLDEVVRMVREESPAARALRARVSVADADVDLAGVYPNPVLAYGGFGRFDGTAQAINGTQHQIWLDVPLLVAGQHDARREVASAEARAARADLEVDVLALEIEARRAFLDALVAQERARQLDAARGELATFLQLVEARAGAGAQSRYDTARIAIEAARVDADLSVAEADARAASALLAAMIGREGWAPRAGGSLEAHGEQYAAVHELPAIRAARARVEAAERDVRRAEAERIPELRVGAGAYFTTDGDSSSAYLGLAIPLPVFDTGEAAVRRARAAHDAASEARDAIEAISSARIEGALAVLAARRAALGAFDERARARVPELQQMAEASYRLGASGVFELLDAFRARVELELARIELLATLAAAEIDLLAIVGR